MNHQTLKTAIIALLLAGVCVLAETAGQEGTSSQPATQPEAPVDLAVAELKPEVIEDRIRQVEAATNIDTTVKAELLGLLRQTLDHLKRVDTWTQETQRLEQRLQQLPVELTQLRGRLEQATSAPATQPQVDVPPDATLESINRNLQDAETRWRKRQEALRKSEEDIQSWSERRAALPQKLAQTRGQLEEVNRNLNIAPVAGMTPELAEARRNALLANRRAIEQEIKVHEQEFRVFDTVGSDVLIARRDVARMEHAQAQAVVKLWQRIAVEKRQADIEKQRQEAERQVAQAPAAVRKLAEQNKQLAKERGELQHRINETVAREKKLNEITERLDNELQLLKEKIRLVGMATYVGPLLSKQRAMLPNITGYRRDIRVINERINQVQFRQIELGQERSLPENLEHQVQQQLRELREAQPDLDYVRIEPEVRNLLRGRQEFQDSLSKDYDTHLINLIDLNIAANRLVDKTEEFEDFINERVLWMPSNDPLFKAKLPEPMLPPKGTIPAIVDALSLDMLNHAATYATATLVLLSWLVMFRRLNARRGSIERRVLHIYTDSFALTWQEILIDFYHALPLPMILWFLGSRIFWSVPADPKDVYYFAYALSQALRRTPLSLFVLLFLLNIFRKDGLADKHFHWSPRLILILRNNLRWLTIIGPPLVFAAIFANYQNESWRDAIGRSIYVLLMGILTVFGHRVLHPRYGVLVPAEPDDINKHIPPKRLFWYLFATSIPVGLLMISAAGYHYTAVELTRRMTWTMWLIVGLLVIRSTIVRAIVVSHRKLAIRMAKEERGMTAPPADLPPGHAPPSSPTDQQAAEELSERTKTLLRWLVAFGLLTGIWGIWQEIVPAFGFVNRIEIWSYTAEVPKEVPSDGGSTTETRSVKTTVSIKLSHLLLALIVVAATVVLATNGPNVIETLLLVRLPLDPGGRFAIAAILRYLILVIGFVLAFGMIGINWSKIQWLAAAITVGLGFGLQEIFANFVSGLIILFERPIRIGDTVTVGDVSGTVGRIQIRATTIVGWDRKELVIPNKEFVTGKVINWTLSDSVLRISVPVGIAYGSDTALADNLLRKVADEHPFVLRDPPPVVLFKEFGESSLDFELFVFINQLKHIMQVRNDLHRAIDEEFRKAGIEIAFPQRDIHIRSIKDALPLADQPRQPPNP